MSGSRDDNSDVAEFLCGSVLVLDGRVGGGNRGVSGRSSSLTFLRVA